nr:pyridoxal-phosphate dependent enzyme [Stappia sp. MMSF_3263]
MTRVHGYCCLRCGKHYPRDFVIDSRGCPACHGEAPSNLRLVGSPDILVAEAPSQEGGKAISSLWRYAHRLPCPARLAVSFGEGLTPLLPAPRLGTRIGVPQLLIKDEGRNPTWSHKDRFSSVAVSVARVQGARVVATASSGNAGASLAAYAARAGLTCVTATFAGAAGPMLAQIHKTGAIVVPFASKTDRWKFLAEGVERLGWFATSPYRAPVVGSHPAGIEGYKTLAFELVEQMHGQVPDWCVLPVCYGDALAGLWRGFLELQEERSIDRLPRLVAAEVHGSLSAALAGDQDCLPDVKTCSDTVAVSIGATRSAYQALNALRQSDGVAVPIGDCDLIACQEQLSLDEGLFAELASVAPFAAIEFLRTRNVITQRDRVVAIVTASGLKDIDRSMCRAPEQPTFSSVAEAWSHISAETRLHLRSAQEPVFTTRH